MARSATIGERVDDTPTRRMDEAVNPVALESIATRRDASSVVKVFMLRREKITNELEWSMLRCERLPSLYRYENPKRQTREQTREEQKVTDIHDIYALSKGIKYLWCHAHDSS